MQPPTSVNLDCEVDVVVGKLAMGASVVSIRAAKLSRLSLSLYPAPLSFCAFGLLMLMPSLQIWGLKSYQRFAE